MRNDEPLSADDLVYTATARCVCGSGLAFAPGSQLWQCADSMLGQAKPNAVHTAALPVSQYRYVSENAPQANGESTRNAPPDAPQAPPRPVAYATGTSTGMAGPVRPDDAQTTPANLSPTQGGASNDPRARAAGAVPLAVPVTGPYTPVEGSTEAVPNAAIPVSTFAQEGNSPPNQAMEAPAPAAQEAETAGTNDQSGVTP